jgi:uncharacterized membrane protein YphA (DoxX/SURF4 family)
MVNAFAPSNTLNQCGQNVVRILIASYFIAVSTGLISGTNLVALTRFFLPEHAAGAVAAVALFTMGFLVLTGVFLRVTAMLLALTLFWSSFIAAFQAPSYAAIGDFWRDLALIGALILTYAARMPRAESRRQVARFTPRVRRIQDCAAKPKAVVPRRVCSGRDTAIQLRRTPVLPVGTVTPAATDLPEVPQSADEPVVVAIPAPLAARVLHLRVPTERIDNIFAGSFAGAAA